MQGPSSRRFERALTATAVGVYLLVVVGATTSLTDAATACPTWPACNGHWVVPLDDPKLAIAWGHRVAALVVGVLLLATTLFAWIRDSQKRVQLSLATSAVLYPIQVGLGAIAATTVTTTVLTASHLVIGMAIFSGIVLALAWTLEPETKDGPVEMGVEQQPADVSPTPESLSGIKATAYAYFRLMKPRLMWLLCLVASAGMALAAGPDLEVGTVVATLTGGVLSIGASGTFNHVLERDVDKRMNRTADRPAATSQIPVRNAVAFGVLLSIASLAVFLSVNVLVAVFGLTAIVFYSVVYTLLLKPNTVQNTVIGGLAGSLPALIGWAAVTNGVGLPALVLAGVIFLWTPAHFYNLALAYKDDYARGGFPMMPVVRGEAETRKHILLWLGATLLAAGGLATVTTLSWTYAATTVVFGAVFLLAVVKLHHDRDEKAAFRSFHASNAYLGSLLVAIVVDALVL
ncbi:heme o synthase [Haladaptatus caseinilyticus]|uniref:heme o synthase n=1 Tax=Haladaptatus caseinilyticus TaxID=2993314 RepID=UPI00224B7254|nr:heme o synthase [Haladaptatus caseinilyticus]